MVNLDFSKTESLKCEGDFFCHQKKKEKEIEDKPKE